MPFVPIPAVRSHPLDMHQAIFLQGIVQSGRILRKCPLPISMSTVRGIHKAAWNPKEVRNFSHFPTHVSFRNSNLQLVLLSARFRSVGNTNRSGQAGPGQVRKALTHLRGSDDLPSCRLGLRRCCCLSNTRVKQCCYLTQASNAEVQALLGCNQCWVASKQF